MDSSESDSTQRVVATEREQRDDQVKTPVRWEDVAEAFEPDGALRDIYVENVALEEWERTLAEIQKNYGPVAFTVDGQPAPLPSNVRDIFGLRFEHSPLLSFSVAGIELACHFFAEDEIEFDLVPGQVNGPNRLHGLIEFLRQLASLLKKPASLTAENARNAVILRAQPEAAHVEYIPPQCH